MSQSQRDSVPAVAIWELSTVSQVGYANAFVVMFSLAGYSELVHFRRSYSIQALIPAGLMVVLGVGYMGLGLLGGIGLLRGDEWGRQLSLMHAIVSVLLFPIGTMIGALSLRYLTRAEPNELVAVRKRPPLSERDRARP